MAYDLLYHHLCYNLYPPVTGDLMYQMAEQAIALMVDDLGDAVVEITVDGKVATMIDRVTGQEVTAADLVANWRLENFVEGITEWEAEMDEEEEAELVREY